MRERRDATIGTLARRVPYERHVRCGSKHPTEREHPRVHERRTNYQAGADFERSVRDYCMTLDGAVYVVRAAGSHGIADLVVFFEAEEYERAIYDSHPIVSPVIRLVQVKRDGRLSEEERELLCSLANEVGASPWLAWQGPRGTLVEMEQVSPNPNAEATEIKRAAPAKVSGYLKDPKEPQPWDVDGPT